MTGQYSLDERPWLVLTEGESDKRFFDKLIAVRGIPNQFQVRFPDRGRDNSGGRSKFGPWLDAAREQEPFIKKQIRGILVVSDNDQDPQQSFTEVRESLRQAAGLTVPAAERVVSYSMEFPPLAILMIPTGVPGNLETLCLQAAYTKWPQVVDPLNAFTANVAAHGWDIGKQSKMRLQAIIAATCEARPESGFVGHWRENQAYHIPLDHAVFNEIDAFLRGFEALIAT